MIKLNKKELWKNITQLDNAFNRIVVSKIPDDSKLVKINKLHMDFMNAIIKTLELEHATWFPGYKGKKGETTECSCCK